MKIPSVQNYVGKKAAERLSKDWNTKVSIKKASFDLFNSLNLEGVYIEDLQKDTLLYAGVAQVKITDWFFLKNSNELTYAALKNFYVNTYRKDSIWNYQFIVDKYVSTDTSKKIKDTTKSIAKKTFSFKNIVLENGKIRQKDKWYGQDMYIDLVRVAITPNKISTKDKILHVNTIDLINVDFATKQYARLKPKSPPKIDSSKVTKYWQLFGWDLLVDKIVMQNCSVATDVATVRAPYQHFDGQHLYFNKINATIDKIKWNTDTVKFTMDLAAKEKSGFEVKKMKSKIVAYPNIINFINLDIVTNESKIKDELSFSFNDFTKDISDFINNINIKANLKDSKISVDDLALFAPEVKKYIPNDVYIDGKLVGTVKSFTGKDLTVTTGNSKLSGDLTMTGLPDTRNTYINFTNGNLSTNYNDIAGFAPSLRNIKGVNLPSLGNIYFNGNFTGFFNDFITYGTIKTDLGTVNADLNLKLPYNKELPSYNGKLLTTSFNLGKLINDRNIKTIGFNGKIEGEGFNLNDINAKVNGTTTRFEYKDYIYENITTNGTLVKRSYNGTIDVNDKNLVGILKGLINFETAKPIIKANGNIVKSDFKQLKFLKEEIQFKGDFDIDLIGANIDEFEGKITLNNATIKNKDEVLPFDFLKVGSNKEGDKKFLDFSSNQFEGYINGKFSYAHLGTAFQLFLNQYYPHIFDKPKSYNAYQNFDFNIKTKNVAPYLKIFSNDIVGLNDATLSGNINTAAQEAKFEGKIPYLAYKNYKLYDLDITGSGNIDSLVSNINVNNFVLNDNLTFNQTVLKIGTKNQETKFSLSSKSESTLNDVDINGNLTLYNDGVQINFEPSNFTANNKKWDLQKNGELILRKSVVYANDITFKHSEEEIVIKSELDGDGPSKQNIIVDLKNMEINDFLPLFVKQPVLYGKLTGTVRVTDPADKLKLEAQSIVVKDFVKDNEYIGKIDINGDFDLKTITTNYNIKSSNDNYKFDITGTYKKGDSLQPPISNKITLKGTKLTVIEPYIKGIFDSTSGKAFGELEIFGNEKKQFIVGKVNVDTLSTVVKFTRVKYLSYNPTFTFNINDIDFTGINLYDRQKRSAKVISGKIEHDGFFGNMGLNIDVQSSNIEAINTTRFDNSTIYGSAVSDAKLSIKGKIDGKLKMDIVATNPTAADIIFNTSSTSRTLGKANFIEFKEYGEEMEKLKPVSNSSLDINIRVKANENAKITVVLDEETNDRLTAVGDGDLLITMADNIKMSGDYTVKSGFYYFSRQGLFNKEFKLKEASTIKWSGDPTNAKLDIEANYLAETVNLADFMNSSNNSSGSQNFAPANLIVSAKITEFLAKPKIGFDINFAPSSPVNPDVQNSLTFLKQDPDQMNKQVAFLVIFNRLINPNQLTALRQAAVESGVNTISSIITTEANSVIGNLVNKAFGTSNIKTTLDFRAYSLNGIGSTTDLDRAIGSLNLSKDIVKNKITILVGGNVDFSLFSRGGASNTNKFSLLPNLALEYKILPNGQLIGTVFFRQSLDLLATGTDNARRSSSGIGIASRKESSTFGGLFTRRRKIKP